MIGAHLLTLLKSHNPTQEFSQIFPRLTTDFRGQGRCLVIYETLPLRVINASQVLDIAQSVQALGLMLTYSHYTNLTTQLKDFAPKTWISQR
jgi:hypothetical protein